MVQNLFKPLDARTTRVLADIGAAFGAASNNPFAMQLATAAQGVADRREEEELDEETMKFVQRLAEDPKAEVPENMSAKAAQNAFKMASDRSRLIVEDAEAGVATERTQDELTNLKRQNIVLGANAALKFNEARLQERFGETLAQQEVDLNAANIDRLVEANAFNKDTKDIRKNIIQLEQQLAKDTFKSNVDRARAEAELKQAMADKTKAELAKFKEGLPANVKNMTDGQLTNILRAAILQVDPNNPYTQLHPITGEFDEGAALQALAEKGMFEEVQSRVSSAINTFQRTQNFGAAMGAINPFQEQSTAPTNAQAAVNAFSAQPQATPPAQTRPTPQPGQWPKDPRDMIDPRLLKVGDFNRHTGELHMPDGTVFVLQPDGTLVPKGAK